MNVGIIAPCPGDGTSFYRAFGPFNYLSRFYGVKLITASEWEWSNITRCDLVFLQRPFTAAHVMVARSCKIMRVPLWVDYDDLLSGFPDWIAPQRDMYGSEESLQNQKQCLEFADVVTVSTPALQSISTKAEVIPNALNTFIWGMSDAPRKNVISWRGSGGHLGDMDPIVPTITRIAGELKGWEFHWFGNVHYKLAKLGAVHPYTNLFSYMHEFQQVAPTIHIVPLEDNAFNRAKSNCAWLEATAAGAMVVAPNLPEWIRPGILNYSAGNAQDFEATLRRAINMSEAERADAVAQSRQFIEAGLTLARTNEQRAEILKRFAP